MQMYDEHVFVCCEGDLQGNLLSLVEDARCNDLGRPAVSHWSHRDDQNVTELSLH